MRDLVTGIAPAQPGDAPSQHPGPETDFPAEVTAWAYWPTRPSMRSRRKSAWPMCRAYSSIMCTSASRTEMLSCSPRPLSKLTVAPRSSWAATNCSAKATSPRQVSRLPRRQRGRRPRHRTPRYGRRGSGTAGARPGRPVPGGTRNARRRPDAAPGRPATGRTAAPTGPPWQPRPSLRTLLERQAVVAQEPHQGVAFSDGRVALFPRIGLPHGDEHVRPAEGALGELFSHHQEVSAGTGRMRYRFCRLPPGRPAAPGEVGPVRRAGSCWGSGCSGQSAWAVWPCRAAQAAPPVDVQVERPVHQANTYSRLRPRRLLCARAAVPGTRFIERKAVAAFSGQVWLAVRSICRARSGNETVGCWRYGRASITCRRRGTSAAIAGAGDPCRVFRA